ncbi:MAG: aspartate carbamoyltransferase regulatory subunit [Candidatus Aenigmatarchaeota archaeon]|nr:MAG: aspartate carbamoyltransferase regulatory subunit [Candidatus Aenigmarchaeota archaeon]
MNEELKVRKIENGIVLDHLPAGKSPDIMKILGVDNQTEETISILMNVSSTRQNKKDIIKIEGKDFEDLVVDKIALLAPGATVNIIKDFNVVEKRKIKIPDVIDVVSCPNPSCITNQREPVKPRLLVEAADPLKVRCYYCERVFNEHDLLEKL